MSAREIICLIEALPENDKTQVADFVRQMSVQPSAPVIRRMDLASVDSIAERVFSEHAELFRKLAQ